jgi:hypothetical protein
VFRLSACSGIAGLIAWLDEGLKTAPRSVFVRREEWLQAVKIDIERDTELDKLEAMNHNVTVYLSGV